MLSFELLYLSFWRIPLIGNFIVMLCLFAFDKFLAPHHGRWFSIHSFANTLVVIVAFPGMWASLKDPLFSLDSRVYTDRSLFGNASPWPVYIINSLHVYHLVFFQVSGAELFHHLVFVPVIGFLGQYYDWGAAQSFMAFFISGLPGAIDYLLLVLVKNGKLNPNTQKRVCASLNVYLRGPFIIVSAHTIYIAMIYGHLTVPKWVCSVILVISLFNSLYYTKQSVTVWAISAVSQSFTEMTGFEMPNWENLVKTKSMMS